MNCERCGIEFLKKYSKWSDGRFCSKKCSQKRNLSKESREKISKKLKENIPWNKGLKIKKRNICKCGNEIGSYKSSKKYCSMECYVKYFDFSASNKKAYENGRKVFGGTCKWYDYKGIRVQGTYELRMCKILDEMKKGFIIKNWEYTNDRIKYIGLDKKEHVYLLDFKIEELNGSFTYYETKGYIKIEDVLKWMECKKQRLDLQVFYKRDIIELEKVLNISV